MMARRGGEGWGLLGAAVTVGLLATFMSLFKGEAAEKAFRNGDGVLWKYYDNHFWQATGIASVALLLSGWLLYQIYKSRD